jgi:hypothetical protein
MAGTRWAHRAAALAVVTAAALAASGCESTVTDTDVAVHCLTDSGNPLAGVAAPVARTHHVTSWVTPVPATPGGTVWVDLRLTDAEGRFIVGPDTTMAIDLPVPEGLRFTSADVEDPDHNPMWLVEEAGAVVTLRYASPPATAAPIVNVPRFRFTFTVTAAAPARIPLPTYRVYSARRPDGAYTETTNCEPDDPAAAVGIVEVADGP